LARAGAREIAGLAWSPSGRRLAYDSTDPETERSSIMITSARGEAPRTLAVDVDARWPSWSPDARRLAFTESVPGPDGQAWDEYIDTVGSDGSDLRRLGPGREPTWSPDGHLIAFTRFTPDNCGDVMVSAPDGSNARVVAPGRGVPTPDGSTACTPAQSPDFSPDGQRLLVLAPGRFDANHVLRQDLYTVDLDGQRKQRVLRDHGIPELLDATFSPDGRRIAFSGDRGRYTGTFTIGVDGRHLRRLSRRPFAPLAWAPRRK
jgi:Tol biopolymer transport system component